jgi:hypothetical protein
VTLTRHTRRRRGQGRHRIGGRDREHGERGLRTLGGPCPGRGNERRCKPIGRVLVRVGRVCVITGPRGCCACAGCSVEMRIEGELQALRGRLGIELFLHSGCCRSRRIRKRVVDKRVSASAAVGTGKRQTPSACGRAVAQRTTGLEGGLLSKRGRRGGRVCVPISAVLGVWPALYGAVVAGAMTGLVGWVGFHPHEVLDVEFDEVFDESMKEAM